MSVVGGLGSVCQTKMEKLSSPLTHSHPKASLLFLCGAHACSCSSSNIKSSLDLLLTPPLPPPLRRPNLKPPIKPLNNTNTWRQKLSKTKIRNPTPTADILRLMDGLSLPIPPNIFTSLIRECTAKKDSAAALLLNAYISRTNTNLKPNLLLLNRLLLMHVSCGQLYIARQLFDQMTSKDSYSWAIMIVAYIHYADYQESITLFADMMNQQQGQPKSAHMLLLFPPWIMVCILKASVETMDMGLGKQVHALLLKLGCGNNISFTGSLINFYGKFRCLDDANFVFSQLTHHNTVVWTAKIVNDCREGRFHDVLHDFTEMAQEGIKTNRFTFSSVLKACAGMDDNGKCGQQVHANVIKIGLESEVYVHCGLIDMYGKCGLLRDAKMVFEMIGINKNIASWNAMLTGYVHNGFYLEAIKFLYQMKAAGIDIQESLIKDVRIACGSQM